MAKPPQNPPPNYPHDPYTDDNDIYAGYPNELAALGRCALLWNEIEALVDDMFFSLWQIPREFRAEIISRINGFDGKVALIKARMANGLGSKEHEVYRSISATLGEIEKLKSLRDAAVHMSANFEVQIAVTRPKRGKVKRMDAAALLAAINAHAEILRVEADIISNILLACRGDLSCVLQPSTKKGSPAQQVLADIPRLQRRQNRRKSLGPLPELQD